MLKKKMFQLCVELTEYEKVCVMLAGLLHDVGHGPFSHAFEHVTNHSHEEYTAKIILGNTELNSILRAVSEKLPQDIVSIIQHTHENDVLNQIVSGQLDADRMDYLLRDSYFTATSYGQFDLERILRTMRVRKTCEGRKVIVVKHTGIHSVEDYIMARYQMYWQVYLHKTSVAAEQILIRLLNRAKELVQQGQKLTMSTALAFFVKNKISKDNFSQEVLEMFARLDDTDIISAMKEWQFYPDAVLSKLSKMLLNRDLPKIKVRLNDFEEQKIKRLQKLSLAKGIDEKDMKYFVFTGVMTNRAYNPEKEIIKILTKNGRVVELSKTSEAINLEPLSQVTERYYICYPK